MINKDLIVKNIYEYIAHNKDDSGVVVDQNDFLVKKFGLHRHPI